MFKRIYFSMGILLVLILSGTANVFSEDTPLYFTYSIHVHWTSDNPKDSLKKSDFNEINTAVEAIADTLDKHGAKGTFLVVPNYANAVKKFQGITDNILLDLVSRGHEIGVHTHTATMLNDGYQAVEACGITGITTMGGATRIPGQKKPVNALPLVEEAGFTIYFVNSGPDDRFPKPIAYEYGDPLNNMDVYEQTQSFLIPWRPDTADRRKHLHDLNGKIIHICHTHPGWMTNDEIGKKAATLTNKNFDKLRNLLDAALENITPNRINTWGFVSHQNEYQYGIDELGDTSSASIEALDEFFSYLDAYRDEGTIIYATARQIAEIYEAAGN